VTNSLIAMSGGDTMVFVVSMDARVVLNTLIVLD
jgi:hypothetical protein